MTTYTVEANTGSSMWPVDSVETSPEVDTYLRSQTAFTLHVSPGNSGMYVAPRAAGALVNLIAAQKDVPEENRDLHQQAIFEVSLLVRLAAVHHGAAVNWQQAD